MLTPGFLFVVMNVHSVCTRRMNMLIYNDDQSCPTGTVTRASVGKGVRVLVNRAGCVCFCSLLHRLRYCYDRPGYHIPAQEDRVWAILLCSALFKQSTKKKTSLICNCLSIPFFFARSQVHQIASSHTTGVGWSGTAWLSGEPYASIVSTVAQKGAFEHACDAFGFSMMASG